MILRRQRDRRPHVDRVLFQDFLAIMVLECSGYQNRVLELEFGEQVQVGGTQGVAVQSGELAGKRPVDEPSFVTEVVRLRELALFFTDEAQGLVHYLEAGARFMAELFPVIVDVGAGKDFFYLEIAPDREPDIQPSSKWDSQFGVQPGATILSSSGFHEMGFAQLGAS